MPGDRLRRVNEAVREVLGTAITDGLKDPRIGFVTVTAVDTSPDLRHASVFVSVFGDESARTDTLAGLDDSRADLQAKIARELHFKNTPRLKFIYDDSIDRGIRLSTLIDEVATDLSPIGEHVDE